MQISNNFYTAMVVMVVEVLVHPYKAAPGTHELQYPAEFKVVLEYW